MNLRRGRGRLETYRRGLADSVAFSAGRMPAARSGSWSAPTTLMPRIGTMNPRADSRSAGILAGDTPTGNTPARLPALPGLRRASFGFFAGIGTLNRWPSRAGRKAPTNRTHFTRFALAA